MVVSDPTASIVIGLLFMFVFLGMGIFLMTAGDRHNRQEAAHIARHRKIPQVAMHEHPNPYGPVDVELARRIVEAPQIQQQEQQITRNNFMCPPGDRQPKPEKPPPIQGPQLPSHDAPAPPMQMRIEAAPLSSQAKELLGPDIVRKEAQMRKAGHGVSFAIPTLDSNASSSDYHRRSQAALLLASSNANRVAHGADGRHLNDEEDDLSDEIRVTRAAQRRLDKMKRVDRIDEERSVESQLAGYDAEEGEDEGEGGDEGEKRERDAAPASKNDLASSTAVVHHDSAGQPLISLNALIPPAAEQPRTKEAARSPDEDEDSVRGRSSHRGWAMAKNNNQQPSPSSNSSSTSRGYERGTQPPRFYDGDAQEEQQQQRRLAVDSHTIDIEMEKSHSCSRSTHAQPHFHDHEAEQESLV